MTRDISREMLAFQTVSARVAQEHQPLGTLSADQVRSVVLAYNCLPLCDRQAARDYLTDGMLQCLQTEPPRLEQARAYSILYKAVI